MSTLEAQTRRGLSAGWFSSGRDQVIVDQVMDNSGFMRQVTCDEDGRVLTEGPVVVDW
ncbi:hypothetical protein [Streptomyces sp. NRRL B-3229]|uniref:hypothetical protein n=1 Tax=Streptomyces sp. NRRL B-3229 TaxID=1463836 RepID=UPI000A5E2663|nr:hypothetical protein [Streptomyces sp. NRRL B-3229]